MRTEDSGAAGRAGIDQRAQDIEMMRRKEEHEPTALRVPRTTRLDRRLLASTSRFAATRAERRHDPGSKTDRDLASMDRD